MAIIASRQRSSNWPETRPPSFAKVAKEAGLMHASTRLTTSFRYVGPAMNRTEARMLLGR